MIIEQRRFAEQDVFRVGVVGALYRCHAVEPDDLDGARAVGEQGLQTALASLADGVEREEASPQLDRRLVAMQVIHMVDDAAVDVAEGEVVQQVIVGRDAQLLAEQFGTLGPHAVHVLYVGVAQVRHFSTSIRQGPGPWDG